jgi:hypothetical protein
MTGARISSIIIKMIITCGIPEKWKMFIAREKA